MGITMQIIHNETDGGEYRLLADFFRTNGFIVFNHVIRTNDVTFTVPLRHEYDYNIVIADEFEFENDKDNMWVGIRRIYGTSASSVFPVGRLKIPANPDDNTVHGAESHEDGIKLQYIQECIKKLQIDDGENLKRIAKIYINYHLLRYKVALSSLYFRREIVVLAQKSFKAAREKLMGKIAEHNLETNYHAMYFRMILAKLINETCNMLKQQLEYDAYKCNDILSSFLGNNQETAGPVNYLMGELLSVDQNKRFDSNKCYENAIKATEGLQYSSFYCYLLGRYYEKNLQNWDIAEQYYKKAARARDDDYRVVYKLAMVCSRNGDYYGAVFYFKKITELLEEKEKENNLEPKEYEYLFKAYFALSRLYELNLNDSKRAEEMLRKKDDIVRLAGDLDRKNKMYVLIYGSEPWADDSDDDKSNRKKYEIDIRKITQDRITHLCL